MKRRTFPQILASEAKAITIIITSWLSGYQKDTQRTSLRGVAVTALECNSESRGFESHHSHVRVFSTDLLLSRIETAMGPVV